MELNLVVQRHSGFQKISHHCVNIYRKINRMLHSIYDILIKVF